MTLTPRIAAQDPTADEMRAYLLEQAPESEEFDREEAIYWFSADWHAGQGSNLYAALSTSEFKPGACSSGPGDEGMGLYVLLAAEYAEQPLG